MNINHKIAKILTLFASSFFLLSCLDSNDQLLQDITKQVKPVRTMTHGYRVLNLDSLTNFTWDSVYFFNEDTRISEINANIGSSWRGPSVPASYNRLVFVNGSEVVDYVDIYYDKTYAVALESLPIWMFGCPGARGRGISRKSAKFAVFRNCASGLIDYKMVPLECVNHFRELIEQGCSEKTLQLVNRPHTYDSTGRIIPIQDTVGLQSRSQQSK